MTLLPRLGALLFIAALAAPAWAQAERPPGLDPALDVTGRYETFLTEGRLDRPAIEAAFERVRPRLERMHILMVPSWLTSAARSAQPLGFVPLLDEQAQALKAEGLSVSIAAVNSEASVPANALALKAEVERLDKPVCLVTHSKGGLDALEFLLRADPALRSQVACWLALQAPFAGSPLADAASELPALRWMAQRTLEALGGDGRSLLDLREDVRLAYLETFDQDIEALARKLPILAFASWIDPASLDEIGATRAPAAAAGFFLDWLQQDRERNDGLVPLSAAALPHAPYVIAGGIDHNMAISSQGVIASAADRILLTKLLLALTLDLDRV